MATTRHHRTGLIRRGRILRIAGIALTLATGAAWADSSNVVGEWVAEGNIHIQLYRCSETLCGRIVKIPDPSRKDTNNTNPRLRTRPIVGSPVLSMARPVGAGWKGDLYHPESGRTSIARMTPNDRSTLIVETCIFFDLICRAETWRRVR